MSRVESQQLRGMGAASNYSSDGELEEDEDDSYDEPWDVPRPNSSQDSAEQDKAAGNKNNTNSSSKRTNRDAALSGTTNSQRNKMRGTAVNEVGDLPALSISRSDEEMNSIDNRRKGGVLTGQRTLRPLSPPSTAGMPGNQTSRRPQDRDDVEDDEDDDDLDEADYAYDYDDMPMDERMDYKKRLSEAVCMDDVGEATGAADLCAYTLTKMNDICGTSPVQGSPAKKRWTEEDDEEDNGAESRTMRGVVGRQDIPSGVDEQTAIEVEYVEPDKRTTPPRRKRRDASPTRTDETSATTPSPPKKGLLLAFSRRQRDRKEAENLESTMRSTRSPERARSPDASDKPKRKSALLNAMTKRAKEDYEKERSLPAASSSSGAQEKEPSAAPDNAYSSFNQSEKRKFLKLINSGLTPSDATKQVVEERQSGEAALEQVGEGSSSKNSFGGRLSSLWKRGGKQEQENVPRDIMPQEAPKSPKSPKSPRRAEVQQQGEEDESLFARSGIGYYDAVRKETDEPEEDDYGEESRDEEVAQGGSRRKSLAKKKNILPKFARKGFSRMDSKETGEKFSSVEHSRPPRSGVRLSPQKPAEDLTRGASQVQQHSVETPDRSLPQSYESPAAQVRSPPKLDRSTGLPPTAVDIDEMDPPALTTSRSAPQQTLASTARGIHSTEAMEPRGVHQPEVLMSRGAIEPNKGGEASGPDHVFRPIPVMADGPLEAPAVTRTFSEESLLNDDVESEGAQMPEEKKEEVSAADTSRDSGADIEEALAAQILGKSPDRSVDGANYVVSTRTEPMDNTARQNQGPSMNLDDLDLDVEAYLNSTALLTNSGSSQAQDHQSVMSTRTGKTSGTGMSYGTNYTTSTRSRRPGAAKMRLAVAKQAEKKQGKSRGWQESIQAAAANTNREWDPQQGWIDYVDPTSVVDNRDASAGGKIHVNIDRVKLAHPQQEEKQEIEQDNGPAPQVLFPQDWKEERSAMLQGGQAFDNGIVVHTKPDAPAGEAERALPVGAEVGAYAQDVGHRQEVSSPERSQEKSAILQSVPEPVQNKQTVPSRKSRTSPATGRKRESDASPKARGWVESMKAATASLAVPGKRWDPDRGWVGMEDDESETTGHQDRYGESVSAQAESDTQDFGMIVVPHVPENNKNQQVPDSEATEAIAVENHAISRSLPAAHMDGEQSIDSGDQSRGASIKSGRSGRYMQIGDTGSVKSHYRNPAAKTSETKDSLPAGHNLSRVVEEQAGEEREEKQTMAAASKSSLLVNVVKEKVGQEDAGLFPALSSKRSAGPVDLDDLYDEENGSFDEQPDFSWDEGSSNVSSLLGSSPPKGQAQATRHMNAVPKIRIKVKDTSPRGGAPRPPSSGRSVDSRSVATMSSTGKPIPKLRGPKRDTSPIRGRKTRKSGPESSPQPEPEVVSIEKRPHNERMPSLSVEDKSAPLVPIHSDVDGEDARSGGQFNGDSTQMPPLGALAPPPPLRSSQGRGDSGGSGTEGHFTPDNRTTAMEEQHSSQLRQISPEAGLPPSRRGDEDDELGRYADTHLRQITPDSSPSDLEGAETSHLVSGNRQLGPPRPERSLKSRSIPTPEQHGRPPVTPERPTTVSSTSPEGDDTSFISTDSKRSSVKLRAQFWESQAKSSEDTNKDDMVGLGTEASEWKSFLAKKVQAASAAAKDQRQRSSKGREDDKDSLFDFPESEGAFPSAARSGNRLPPGAANQQRSRQIGGEPNEEAFEEISDLSPIRVQHDEDDDLERISETSSAVVQPSTSSSFLQRLQACAAPIMQRATENEDADCNAVPMAHLAFLRTNPALNGSAEKPRSSRFNPPNFCGRPDVIDEGDEGDEDEEEETSDQYRKSVEKTGSRSNPKTSRHSDVGSVISEEAFGAKTAYLEAIAMKTAVSGSKKSKRRLTGSDASASVSSRHSEKWQRFLDKKGSASTGSQGEERSNNEVSRAAEKYAAEKVEQMMDTLAQRTNSTPFESRPMEEATGAFPSVKNSRPPVAYHADQQRRNESARAAEDLAAARVEAMMQALSHQHVDMDEGEI